MHEGGKETGEPFSVLREDEAGTVVLAARGELDLGSAPRLRQRLRDCVHEAAKRASDGVPRVVLDLRGLSFMDSTGLGLLIEQRHAFRERGGDLWLVDAPDGTASHLLQIAGLDDEFPLHATRLSAAAEIEADRNQ